MEVVLDQPLSLKHILSQQADQSQEPVHLSQVEDGAIVETNDGGGVLVIGCAVRVISKTVCGQSENQLNTIISYSWYIIPLLTHIYMRHQ